jgi:site-specific DNA-methyltransferase (cytosine-N4-specific)
MPEALARRCILAGSEFGDHVLDPFGGSGTVSSVANREGRRATLIDIDERSVSLTNDRTIQQGLCPIVPRAE